MKTFCKTNITNKNEMDNGYGVIIQKTEDGDLTKSDFLLSKKWEN